MNDHRGATVLVVGASGLVGTAAVERFLADGADVIGLSRRAPELDGATVEPPGADRSPPGRYTHLPLDLRDADACRAAATGWDDVTHVVYAAVHELPGLVAGWFAPEQMDTNLAMLRNVLDPLVAALPQRVPVQHRALRRVERVLAPLPPVFERRPRSALAGGVLADGAPYAAGITLTGGAEAALEQVGDGARDPDRAVDRAVEVGHGMASGGRDCAVQYHSTGTSRPILRAGKARADAERRWGLTPNMHWNAC